MSACHRWIAFRRRSAVPGRSVARIEPGHGYMAGGVVERRMVRAPAPAVVVAHAARSGHDLGYGRHLYIRSGLRGACSRYAIRMGSAPSTLDQQSHQCEPCLICL